ncbi:MAG: NAD(P)H-dependent oxidoreductase subunit E [Burkholderiaceae bacterium]
MRAHVAALIAGLPRRKDMLIECLHRLQDHDRCLSAAALVALADEMRLSQAEVFEVATFYHHFDVVKEGEPAPPMLTVRVCDSLSCEMAGAQDLLDRLPALLGTEVRVQPVPCVGRCDSAPVVIVGQKPVAHASTEAVSNAVASGDSGCPMPEGPGLIEAVKAGTYETLGRLLVESPDKESIFSRLESSGLRGLGGAGFPAGRKWRIVSGFEGERTLVVNADEGEPGTFKDRVYLEADPHRFLEGMLIAAWAVGCSECYIYLRDEYAGVRALLEREIAALTNEPPAGIAQWQLPAIHLRRGAGAYICGEESGLIESIEGRRGMPRLRPPYIAEVGLFGRPTLAHNVETLYWIAPILRDGPDSFASHGRRGRQGLRSFSVSGRVREPGVKLAPAGISVRELIDEYCGGMLPGHELYAYLPGGASGGILPASLADEPLDFDTLQKHGCFIGSAAVIVLSSQDRVRDAALNLMQFFRHESCGQCTPCRVGTAKAVELMQAEHWDTSLLGELSDTMIDASICGLGQAAPNPVQSVVRFFPQEVKA